MKNLIFAAIFLAGSAIADDLTVPNTFQAGTPARAAQVNANFTAVEASVDDNAANTTANASGISTNATNIGGNAQDIDTVAQAVTALMPPPSFQFVGFSAATLNGSAGIFVMNAACHADFGTNSRMASTREILDSTTQPILNSSSSAWVRPEIVAASAPNDTNQYVWDYSGLSHFRADISCDGWSSSIVEGLSLNGEGIFAIGLCSALKFVACSAAP